MQWVTKRHSYFTKAMQSCEETDRGCSRAATPMSCWGKISVFVKRVWWPERNRHNGFRAMFRNVSQQHKQWTYLCSFFFFSGYPSNLWYCFLPKRKNISVGRYMVISDSVMCQVKGVRFGFNKVTQSDKQTDRWPQQSSNFHVVPKKNECFFANTKGDIMASIPHLERSAITTEEWKFVTPFVWTNKILDP